MAVVPRLPRPRTARIRGRPPPHARRPQPVGGALLAVPRDWQLQPEVVMNHGCGLIWDPCPKCDGGHDDEADDCRPCAGRGGWWTVPPIPVERPSRILPTGTRPGRAGYLSGG